MRKQFRKWLKRAKALLGIAAVLSWGGLLPEGEEGPIPIGEIEIEPRSLVRLEIDVSLFFEGDRRYLSGVIHDLQVIDVLKRGHANPPPDSLPSIEIRRLWNRGDQGPIRLGKLGQTPVEITFRPVGGNRIQVLLSVPGGFPEGDLQIEARIEAVVIAHPPE